MKSLQRSLCALLLLALSISLALAQESTVIRGAGSGVVLPLLQQIVVASGTEAALELATTGTAAGFTALCDGTADLAGATRIISPAEEAACDAAGVTFQEVLLGHHILAVIANPADDFQTCLAVDVLNTIFTPAAAATVNNWNQVSESNPDLALSLAIPTADSLTYAQLDDLIRGDGLRSDALSGTPADIIAAVSSTPGTLGVVDLAAAQAALGAVKLVNLNTSAAGCTTPDAAAAENGTYNAALPLYVYLNPATTAAVQPVLAYLVSGAADVEVANAGFSPVSPGAQLNNSRVASGEVVGRLFSRSAVEFIIPGTLTGEVRVAGSGSLFDYFKQVSDGLIEGRQELTFTYRMDGDAGGVRRLCNGEADVIITTTPLSAEQNALCTANNITPISFTMGTQAAVLVGNAADEFTQCLTREQLITVWGAAATGTDTWSALGTDFAETPLTLFAAGEGSELNDILLDQPGVPVVPIRSDIEFNADALYRAAATSNVEGALALLSWAEYQSVLANNQPRLHLVSVDNGSGCVAPSLETIADGSYALTQTTTLVASQAALASINVQSYLWSLYTDSNYASLAARGLIGTDFSRLSDLRVSLQDSFDAAALAARQAAEAAAEATPDPAAEATPAATAEAGS